MRAHTATLFDSAPREAGQRPPLTKTEAAARARVPPARQARSRARRSARATPGRARHLSFCLSPPREHRADEHAGGEEAGDAGRREGRAARLGERCATAALTVVTALSQESHLSKAVTTVVANRRAILMQHAIPHSP